MVTASTSTEREPFTVDDATRVRLWTDAVEVLSARLDASPDDAVLVDKVAELARRLGELDRAAELFGRLADLRPDHPSASFNAAMLSGAGLPDLDPSAGPRPATFLRVEGFLPDEERSVLLDWVRANEELFQPLRVGTPDAEGHMVIEHDFSFRRQLGVKRIAEIDALMGPRLIEALPRMFSRFGVAPFAVPRVDCNVTVCLDGHFAKGHRDDVAGEFRMNFLYYFHRHPKSFDGGDLLLYDVDQGGTHPRRGSGFTRVQPVDNRLVVFPADQWHELTQVTSDSGEFVDGRFAVTGALVHRRP